MTLSKIALEWARQNQIDNVDLKLTIDPFLGNTDTSPEDIARVTVELKKALDAKTSI